MAGRRSSRVVDDFSTLRARHIDAVRAFTPEAIARLSWSRERVRAEQVRRLRRVLAHAQTYSPFHARRLAHIDAEAFELEDLVTLPSMTKDDVMDAWDDVVTDRELHLEDVAVHLDRLLSGEKQMRIFGANIMLQRREGPPANAASFCGIGKPLSLPRTLPTAWRLGKTSENRQPARDGRL
jgi:hypothetical protein